MKVTYTDSGRQALEAFKEAKAKELEEKICAGKYVFGDDEVEITANDIKEASERLGLPYGYSGSRSSIKLVLQVYIFLGVSALILGIFYSNLKETLLKDPVQLALIVGGALSSFASYVMLQRIRVREAEQEKIQRIEKEKSKYA